jgi:hypothetical protein
MTRVHDYGSSLVIRVNVVFKNGDVKQWRAENGLRIEYDYPVVILIANDWVVSFSGTDVLYMEEYLQHSGTTSITKGGVTITTRSDGTDGSWAGD